MGKQPYARESRQSTARGLIALAVWRWERAVPIPP